MTPGDYFADLARCFAGQQKSDDGLDIFRPALLGRSRLDFSLESLKVVDAYLLQLHEMVDVLGPDETLQRLGPTILWAGAYLGETMRRNARPDQYVWIDYEAYVQRYPEVAALLGPCDTATCVLLMRTGGAMCVPIGKVLKLVLNGIEDSVHFFAVAELAAARRQ